MRKKIYIALITILMATSLIFGLFACNKGGNDNTGGSVIAGEFYTLQETYDNGYLTREDLLSIAYYYNGHAANAELTEEYQPIEKSPEILSAELSVSIRQTMVNDLKDECGLDYCELKNISICGYYGTYDGCIAVRLQYSENGSDVAVNGLMHNDAVADVEFVYTDYTVFFHTGSYIFSNAIMIWKANS